LVFFAFADKTNRATLLL